MALVLSQMEMQYYSAKRFMEISESYLKLLIGIPLDEALTLTDSLPSLLQQSVDFQLENTQIKNRLEYQIADVNKSDSLSLLMSRSVPSLSIRIQFK